MIQTARITARPRTKCTCDLHGACWAPVGSARWTGRTPAPFPGINLPPAPLGPRQKAGAAAQGCDNGWARWNWPIRAGHMLAFFLFCFFLFCRVLVPGVRLGRTAFPSSLSFFFFFLTLHLSLPLPHHYGSGVRAR